MQTRFHSRFLAATKFFSHQAIAGLLLVVAGFGLGATIATAQTNTTALTGTVVDKDGLRLPGSTVTILNAATGQKVTVQTRSQGEFGFNQVLPGHYQLTVHHEGFNDKIEEVELFIATPLELNVKLAVGGSSSVEVEAELPSSLNQVDASLGKAFNNLQVETLPYLANNTLSLLALQPGVLSFDASNTLDPRAATINGARQDQTNLTLDGVDNNEANYGYAFTGVLRATRDSIEEFRVTTSGANADAGRSSGAQVSIQTKSGTNQVHGTSYYYYRDPAAASNNWFNKQAQLNSGSPNISAKVLQDTYGATLGLPIVRNKLFFFGAYEGFKQASDSVVTQIVPRGSGNATDAGVAPGLKNGTVTYLNTSGSYTTLTSTQIQNMDTGCIAAGGCPNGPGVNSAMLAYMRQYPLANGSSVGDGYNTGGYTFASPAPISNITNIARFDYNITPKQTLFVRGNLQSDNSASTYQFPGGIPSSNTYGNDRGMAVGHIWNINERLTNNARYGWTRFGNAIKGGVSSDYITFGSTGGFTPLSPTTTSKILVENTNNFADDLTLVKGRHTIQFGGNDRLIYNDRLLTANEFRNGIVSATYFTIGGIANKGTNLDASAYGYPKIATSFNTTYDAAMSEDTGLIGKATEYLNYTEQGNSLNPLPIGVLPTHRYKNFEQEYYAQDEFRVTPKFILTAGLRYSYLQVPYETNGQEVHFNLSLRSFLNTRVADAAVGISYNPQLAYIPGGKANNAPDFWTPGKLDFAPRLAFNYSPDGKTSIRGGFMLAYDHFGQGAIDVFNDSGSFGLSSLYSSTPNLTVNTAPRFTSPTAVPTSIIATPPSGVQTFPLTNAGGSEATTNAIDDQLKTPYAEIFDLSFQREVHRGLTITASYVGRLGRHLVVQEDVAQLLNLEDPISGQTWYSAMPQLEKAKLAGQPIATIQNIPYFQDMFPNATYTTGGVTYKGTQAVFGQLTPGSAIVELENLDTNPANSPAGQSYRYMHPQFGSIETQSSIGVSSYNALQLSLRHTLTKSFVYDFNYTYSHSMDQVSSPERGSSTVNETYTTGAEGTIINAFTPSQNYADSDYDIRHAINADWTLSIPYGHGQHFGANSGMLMNLILGGWSTAGIVKWTSGLPFSTLSSAGWATAFSYRSADIQTAPVQNTGHHTYIKNSSGVITASAFQNGNAAFSSFRVAYAGETGQRNNLRADGYFSLDPGISKSFNTFNKQSLKLTVEAFNVTNTTRFGALPTPNIGQTGGASFGNYTTLLNSPRQMQFSGRYFF